MDLNLSLGCSPFGYQAYPGTLSPGVHAVPEFGVGQSCGPFRVRATQSVALPPELARPGLSYRIFRKEPAIAKLDWFFATNPRSEEGFDCTTPSDLQPVLPSLRPAQGLVAWLQVLQERLRAI